MEEELELGEEPLVNVIACPRRALVEADRHRRIPARARWQAPAAGQGECVWRESECKGVGRVCRQVG